MFLSKATDSTVQIDILFYECSLRIKPLAVVLLARSSTSRATGSLKYSLHIGLKGCKSLSIGMDPILPLLRRTAT